MTYSPAAHRALCGIRPGKGNLLMVLSSDNARAISQQRDIIMMAQERESVVWFCTFVESERHFCPRDPQ